MPHYHLFTTVGPLRKDLNPQLLRKKWCYNVIVSMKCMIDLVVLKVDSS